MFRALRQLPVAVTVVVIAITTTVGCSSLPGGTPSVITKSAFGGKEPACEWYLGKIQENPLISDTQLEEDYAWYNLFYVQLNQQEAREAIDWLKANCDITTP